MSKRVEVTRYLESDYCYRDFMECYPGINLCGNNDYVDYFSEEYLNMYDLLVGYAYIDIDDFYNDPDYFNDEYAYS